MARIAQRATGWSSHMTASAAVKSGRGSRPVVAGDDPFRAGEELVVLLAPRLLGRHGAASPVEVIEVDDRKAQVGCNLAGDR